MQVLQLIAPKLLSGAEETRWSYKKPQLQRVASAPVALSRVQLGITLAMTMQVHLISIFNMQ